MTRSQRLAPVYQEIMDVLGAKHARPVVIMVDQLATLLDERDEQAALLGRRASTGDSDGCAHPT